MFSARHGAEAFSKLDGYRETGYLCDTVLITREKPLKAHGVVLSAVSPFFQSTIESLEEHKRNMHPFGSGRQSTHYIDLQMVEAETVEIALKFIYTSKLVLPQRFAQDCEAMKKLFEELGVLGLSAAELQNCIVVFQSACDFEALSRPDDVSQSQVAIGQEVNLFAGCIVDETTTADVMRYYIKGTTTTATVKQEDDSNTNYTMPANGQKSPQSNSPRNRVELLISNDVCRIMSAAFARNQNDNPLSTVSNSRDSMLTNISQNRIGLNENSNSNGVTLQSAVVRLRRDMVRNTVKTGPPSSSDDFSEEQPLNVLNVDNSPSAIDVLMNSQQVTKAEKNVSEVASPSSKYSIILPPFVQLQFVNRIIPTPAIATALPPRSSSVEQYSATLKRPIFRQKFSPRRSSKSHPSMSTYRCHLCEKSYMCKGTLRSHTQAAHFGAKPPYECRYECGWRGWRAAARTLHEQSHTGARPHLCEHCGKGFSSEQALRAHTVVRHLSKMPEGAFEKFPCTLCDRVFSLRRKLRGHVRRMHEDGAAERKEAEARRKCRLCSVCGKSFASVPSRVTHEKRHCRGEAAA